MVFSETATVGDVATAFRLTAVDYMAISNTAVTAFADRVREAAGRARHARERERDRNDLTARVQRQAAELDNAKRELEAKT
jgi:hypothetical protein